MWDQDEDLISGLVPLMKKYGVQAYIDGHSHSMQYISYEGIEYMVQGVGSRAKSRLSGPRSDAAGGVKFASLSNGFGAAFVTEDTVSISYLDDMGNTLFSRDLTNPRGSTTSSLRSEGPSTSYMRIVKFIELRWLFALFMLFLSVVFGLRKAYRHCKNRDDQKELNGYTPLP